MKRIVYLIVALFITNAIFAQEEANNWYFGQRAGIKFKNGEPQALTDGALSTWEGCSAISTSSGALRFYTDGIEVYNRGHEVMPNGSGLLGDPSSTQSGIIVPDPASDQKYYIFSVDDEDGSGGVNGLNYSVVDMTLEGWYGDVDPDQKNIRLTSPLCEKVTAVGHANGVDTWVIAHKWGTNDIYAYLVTTSGINTTPVISTVGVVVGGSGTSADDPKGYMKLSPDGSKVAKANAGLNNVEIFDFNNNSGVATNALIDKSIGGEPYGIEFSPNNQFLYVNTWKNKGGRNLYQYDLRASDVIASRVTIATGTEGALQLGPDNRIYVAGWEKPNLDRINQPNLPGADAKFERNAVDLEGKTSMMGLPPFVQSFFSFNAGFINEPPCTGYPIQFYQNCSQMPDSLFWDFGDSGSGDDNYSTEFDPLHEFGVEGLYSVKLKVWIEGHEDDVSKFINVLAPPQVDLGGDDFLCEGDFYTIDAGAGYAEYLWNTGDSTQTITVQNAGKYWVDAKNENGCIGTDTLMLNAYEKPVVDLGNDLDFCDGELHQLNAGEGFESYMWSTGDNTSTLVVEKTGNYWVEVTNNFGCFNRDTVEVVFNERPVAEAGDASPIDQGQTTTLNGSATGGSGTYTYEWEPADLLEQNDISNPTTKPLTQPTQFTLTVKDSNGCISESDKVLVNINGSTLFATPIADPEEICQGDPTNITANAIGGGGEYTYNWTSDPPGFESSNADFQDKPGQTITYTLTVTDQFDNSFENSVKVNVLPVEQINLVPDFITPIGQDTIVVCVRDSVLVDAGTDNDPETTTYHWVEANTLNRYNIIQTNGNWFDVQTHEVKVNYGGETACETYGIITVVFDFNKCQIGLDETPENDHAIEMYPNPNNGKFTLLMNEDVRNLHVRVFDLNGSLVYDERLQGSYSPGYKQDFDIDFDEKGMFILHLGTDDFHLVKKMVMQ